MHFIPCKPADLPIPHGAGESKIHCDIQFHVVTLIQRLPDHIRCPDVTFLVVGFRLVRMGERIPCDDLPFYCLLEGTPEYLMDTVDGARREIFTFWLLVLFCHRSCLLQPHIELVHKLRVNILNCHRSPAPPGPKW